VPAASNIFFEVFTRTEAEAALADGIFHREEASTQTIKSYLKDNVEIRLQVKAQYVALLFP